MTKLPGLFDSFDNLDQISIEGVASWLKNPPTLIQIENYLANRILYPQTLPIIDSDMKIDLAILREALKLNGPRPIDQKTNPMLGDNPFLNITLRKILIPIRFLRFVPDIKALTWAFVDGLLLHRKKEDSFSDLWSVILTDDSDEVIGSLILPQFDGDDQMELNVAGKNYKISSGSLIIIPCLKDRCEISYKFNKGKILGKKESAIEIYGGKLGIMVDGRNL